jgi:cytochrome c oxidase cbb3-type subunit 3
MRKPSFNSIVHAGNRAALSAFLLAIAAFAWACEGPPSAESLKEWGPLDHHSADDDKAAAARQGQAAPPAKAPKGSDIAQLVELTWRQQCTSCHGASGKGDGQMGAMVGAVDLTSEELQAKASDAELAAIIKGGKDKMPKFNLPDPVVMGLVARIRQLRGR